MKFPYVVKGANENAACDADALLNVVMLDTLPTVVNAVNLFEHDDECWCVGEVRLDWNAVFGVKFVDQVVHICNPRLSMAVWGVHV